MDNYAEQFKKSYDRYEIIASIGRDTWQIKLISYEKTAVLKRVDNPAVYKRLASLKIKGIPTVYDVFERDGSSYVIEEYINGSTLDKELISGGSLAADKVKDIVLKLCRILEPIHKEGLVHRDIKPSNIVLTGGGEVYLIDFGIAREQNAAETKDTRLLGTEFYASPEQYGFAQTDNKSDIYSIGRLMTALLTGKENADSIRGLPYRRIIKRCTEIAPSKRYKSAAGLRRAFYADYFLIAMGALALIIILAALNRINKPSQTSPNTSPVYKPDETTSEATEITTAEETTSQSPLTEAAAESATAEPQSETQAETQTEAENTTESTTTSPSISEAESTTAELIEANSTAPNPAEAESKPAYLQITPYGIGYAEERGPRVYYNQLEFLNNIRSVPCGDGYVKSFINNCTGEILTLEKYDSVSMSSLGHYSEAVELSQSLKADIYTEKTGSGINISINGGEALNIPEYQPDDEYYSAAKRYYTLAYLDFDGDGIKDIFIAASVYDRYHDKYISPYHINTFVKINPDLTMEILENDTPIIEDIDSIEYLIYNDRIDFCRYGSEDEVIGAYACENGRIYCKNEE